MKRHCFAMSADFTHNKIFSFRSVAFVASRGSAIKLTKFQFQEIRNKTTVKTGFVSEAGLENYLKGAYKLIGSTDIHDR